MPQRKHTTVPNCALCGAPCRTYRNKYCSHACSVIANRGEQPPLPNPSGLCMCGCGEKTPLARQTHHGLGWVKGQPIKFIKGHATVPAKPRPTEAPLCGCGCEKPTQRNRRGYFPEFLPGHAQRVRRKKQKMKPHIAKQCKFCGATFTCPPAKSERRVTCNAKSCIGARRSELMRGINRKGEWVDRVCACGCGTSFLVPMYDVRANKTGKFFLNAEHQRTYWADRRVTMNFYASGNTRYGYGWKELAKQIRERDKVCRDCGKTPEANGRALDVHHIRAFRVSADNSPDNLISLCRSCHTSRTAKEDLPPLRNPNAKRYAEEKTCPACGDTFTANTSRRIVCFNPDCWPVYRKARDQRRWIEKKAARTAQH